MTQTAAEYRNMLELRYDGRIPPAALKKLDEMRAAERAQHEAYEATKSALMDVLETAGTLPADDEEVGHDANALIASLQAKGFTVAKMVAPS